MRGIMFFSVAALVMGAAIARAQEDSVYINLSALDALGSVEAPAAVQGGPLFPVVKAQPKRAPARQAAKPKKQAAKTAKVKVEEIKPKKDIAKTADIKAPAPQKPAPIPYVESTEEVVVVDVEPVAAPEQQVVFQTPEPAASSAKVQEKKAESSSTAVPALQPEKSEIAVPVQPQVSAGKKVESKTAEPAGSDPAAAAQNTVQQGLLIDEQAAEPAGLAKIIFTEGETTLSEAQKAQIDTIIKNFADAKNNKIAIYSYNLDDGVDTFRKKRQSLNRAVEVRSYLLQKGYKNFSIKVLNIDGASDKVNTVELEELK